MAQSRKPVTAWDLQRALEIYFDGTEMAAGGEIAAARQLVQKYQGEAS
ncbi:hypothetical protein [Dongia sp.]